MRIDKLILKKFKPLVLNNVHHFEITITSPHQIILGTNGSGKSSVLRELGPVPGTPADFLKGGSKEIHLHANGSNYQLISTFKSGNRHNFLKDGTELNPGGTGQVQKELVRQEFGVTSEIQELLSGSVCFTDMTPLKRRDWLTMICETDFTYALQVHKRLKTSLRDLQGAIKHNSQRITAENNKLLSLTDMEDVEERYQSLHKTLEILYQERLPMNSDVRRLDQGVSQKTMRLETLATQVIQGVVPVLPGKSYQTLGDIDEDIQHVQTNLRVKEAEREHVGQELTELEKLVQGIRENGVEDLDGLKKTLQERQEERQKLLDEVEQFRIDHEPEQVQGALRQVLEPLAEILHSLPDNSERKYNKDAMAKAQNERHQLRQDMERLENRKARVESQLEHIHQAKETQCPQCGYRWVPGIGERDIENHQKTLAELDKQLEGLQVQVTQRDEYIEVAAEYAHQYQGLRQLYNQYPILRPLWDYLMENHAFTHTPSKWINKLYTFERDVNRGITIAQLTKSCQELTALVEGGDRQGNMDGFANRLTVLEKRAEQTTQDIASLHNELSRLKDYRRKVANVLSCHEQMLALLDEIHQDLLELSKHCSNQVVEEAIQRHQDQLATLSRKRNDKLSIEGIVKDLESNQSRLEHDHAIMEKLVKAISPTDGMIAEQLTGFIGGFVEHLNQIIGNIWTYDFVIRPCGLDDGELDYRFPLEIRGNADMVPDISKGSEAQLEVVNLVFRLVAMMYLRLEQFPLLLDEVGASFDEQHRINVMNVLKQLVDNGNYSQMFLISHYAGQYGAFPKSETTVLDSANIAVPGTYNQHVVME